MEVLDFFEVPMPAFIMRFVASGDDLRDYLNKKGKFSGKQRENGRPNVRLLTKAKVPQAHVDLVRSL
jgi:hypothetical protein